MTPRLLVTGGNGFIGEHIVDQARAAGWNVAVLDVKEQGSYAASGVKVYQVDIRDREGVLHAFQEFRPDFVSHHAAQVSVSVSVTQPHMDAEVNILGSLNVMDAARAVNVRHLVFASSGGAIYGEVPQGAAPELGQAAPISPYANSKRTIELYLETYRLQYGLASTALRYANVYGPRQSAHGEAGVIAIFISRLLAGQEVQINARQDTGDDGGIRDYLFVQDAVRANMAALEGRLPPLVNVATTTGTSTRHLLDTLAGLLNVTPQVRAAPRRAGDIQRSVVDAPVFRQLIGEPVPLSEGLRQTVKAFQEAAQKP